MQATQILTPEKSRLSPNVAQLHEAFEAFNSMSAQLSESYKQLESRVVELSGELADVSQQRLDELAQKEQLAEQLQTILTIMPAGVVVLDHFGVIQQINPNAQQLFKNDGDLLGKKWANVVKENFKPRKNDGHEISLIDGRLVSVSIASLGEQGQLILLNDQTETRALQDKLNHHQRLSEMGRMVASLAHQIRTPLSAAMLYANGLKSEKIEDEQRLRFSGKLLNRLVHIEQQIRDMLIFVRGETQLSDELTCKELIELLALEFEPQTENRQLIFNARLTSDDGIFLCNKDSLISAIGNVVNNAIEATQYLTIIELVVTRKQGLLTISIKDNGPGINEENLKKIFEPFYTTKAQGTGLGLAVVSAIVKAHGGQIQVVNDSGCQFTLTLPL